MIPLSFEAPAIRLPSFAFSEPKSDGEESLGRLAEIVKGEQTQNVTRAAPLHPVGKLPNQRP
jgi:hypothetical protein